jgi:hypothetical protein
MRVIPSITRDLPAFGVSLSVSDISGDLPNWLIYLNVFKAILYDFHYIYRLSVVMVPETANGE